MLGMGNKLGILRWLKFENVKHEIRSRFECSNILSEEGGGGGTGWRCSGGRVSWIPAFAGMTLVSPAATGFLFAGKMPATRWAGVLDSEPARE